MPTQIEFFDLAVSVTPPNGYYEPVPFTLGASWEPGDVRVLFVCAYASEFFQDQSTETEMKMKPSPPTGFSPAYSLNPSYETYGTFYRYLQPGDTDITVAFPKPTQWRIFMWATMTARGVSPTVVPTAGLLGFSRKVDDTTVTVSSVTVPAAGTMVYCIGNVADPGGEQWPGWGSAMGVPTGWVPMVATDKSGVNYFPYDTNPAIEVIGKSYTTSGSTGSVAVPCVQGMPAFAGMYAFFQPGQDVSVSVGAA